MHLLKRIYAIHMKRMNRNELKRTNINYSLLSIIEKFFEIDKKTRYYGTDKPLFHAEIHTIKAIKENKGIHITGLAEYLGVTKGAVSQIAIKLDRKGLIIKEKDADNLSRFLLQLTPLGELAYSNHLQFHENFNKMIDDLLKDESKDKILFLKNFLMMLDDKLDTFEDISDR